MSRYFIIHKPFQVLSQFSAQDGKQTLHDFFKVPPDVYPVGRLDYDSEGLLLLTNDTSVNYRLLQPTFFHEREYWVQVENVITPEALTRLQAGVTIATNGKNYRTLPCKASLFDKAPHVAERNPPIRYRKNIPACWMSLVLTEGKNRQVRKMTAAVGFPTLRLIRYRIGNLTLNELQPGDMQELNRVAVYRQLFNE
jgi:23S rRNA pseudouridine2457 synthase